MDVLFGIQEVRCQLGARTRFGAFGSASICAQNEIDDTFIRECVFLDGVGEWMDRDNEGDADEIFVEDAGVGYYSDTGAS
ncbi:hypothetical protein NEOLEDRAFT_1142369 [Neolentinus lepideus HHB14362 ss-1]|uniref:Uncharacterized protein n=1 Tax=Neolentinus lepideus HHB14362 ss-1 TaxID=1314782 RepID=A0A165N589_9AGAM|nr:hypothetical protein NEOLEDRAFT_1143452 [Neolentinus lepideus HHB14362 ss-1]KZT19196.1 hypothetical protein NEOLEDRAFT_1142369 [Neolentinus lepideus HHB14362 ss-1]